MAIAGIAENLYYKINRGIFLLYRKAGAAATGFTGIGVIKGKTTGV
jgi:hypothetical protein